MKKKYEWLDKTSMALVAVGGVNWGLVGIFNYNLVTSIVPGIANIIYGVVGVATVYLIYKAFS